MLGSFEKRLEKAFDGKPKNDIILKDGVDRIANELKRIRKASIKGKVDVATLQTLSEALSDLKSSIENAGPFNIRLDLGRKDAVEVANFDDLKFPDALKITNLEELKEFFDALSETIKATFSVEIPEPKVTVNVPKQDAPELDLSPIVDALEDVKTALAKKPKPESKKEFSLLAKLLKEIKAAVSKKQSVTVHSASSGLQQDEFESSIKKQMSPAGNGSGRKVCTTAGTAVVLASNQACKYVLVTAEEDNTDIVVVGATPVATSGSMEGVPLEAARSQRFDVSNLNQLKVNSRVNGEGVCFEYFS